MDTLIEAFEKLNKQIKSSQEIKLTMNNKTIDLSTSPTMKLIKDFEEKYLVPVRTNINKYEAAKKEQPLSEEQERTLKGMKYRVTDIEELLEEFSSLVVAHTIFYKTVVEVVQRLTGDEGIVNDEGKMDSTLLFKPQVENVEYIFEKLKALHDYYQRKEADNEIK